MANQHNNSNMDDTTNDSVGEQKMESQAPPPPPPPPPVTYPLFDVIAICNFAPAPPALPSDNKIVKATTNDHIAEEKEASSYNSHRNGRRRQNVGPASRNGYKASPSAANARKRREELANKGGHDRRQRPEQAPVLASKQREKTSSIADRYISSVPAPTAGTIQLDGKESSGTTSGIPDAKTGSPRTRGKHEVTGVSTSSINSPSTSIKKFDDDKRIPSSPRDTTSRINVDTNRKNRSPKISAIKKFDDETPATPIESQVKTGTVGSPYYMTLPSSTKNILETTQSSIVQKSTNFRPIPDAKIANNDPHRSILKHDSREESSSEETSSSEDNTPVPMTVVSNVSNHSRTIDDLLVDQDSDKLLRKETGSVSDDDSSRIMPRRTRNPATSTGRRIVSSNSSVGSMGSGDRLLNSRSVNFDDAITTSNRSNSPTKYSALNMRMMMSSKHMNFDPLKHRLKTYVPC